MISESRPIGESAEARIKRLHMRSMRRGIKEMDIILSAYANDQLEKMPESKIALYDTLLSENDQDLYSWVTGQTKAPEHLSEIIEEISQTFQK